MRPLVVIGDALLDIDLDGVSDRLSPDAPVPVVHDPAERARAGGAGLAASIAATLGDDVVLVTALAGDDEGRRLAELLSGRVELVALPAEGETVRKVRVRAGGQSLVRIDFGSARMAEGPLDDRIAGLLAGAGAVLVADYGRGVAAHPEVRRLLTGLRVPVVWDPHPRGAEPVPGARLVTPSQAEARHLAGAPARATGYEQAVADAAELQRRWEATGVAVTLGARGAVLSMGADTATLVPAPQIANAVDPCGAGDCLAAAAALALRDGRLLTEAVTEGVHRAAEFVAGTLGPDRPPGDAYEVVRRVRETGGTVVATGGCFDLLHAGHVELLRQARALGDCLVVCLNSDDSVRALKGPNRPVVGEQDRARVLAALDCVDAVLTFPERTPGELIERLRPDLWVKGGDYGPADLPETEVVRRHGGEVVILPYLEGRSTSRLVERVRA